MSYQAVCWALKQPIKPPTAKHLLTVMAHYVSATKGDEWLAYASVSRLVEDTGQDRKTIMANLKRLAEMGYLIDTGKREGDTKRVPVFQLNTPGNSTNPGTNGDDGNGTDTGTISDLETVPEQAPLNSTNPGTDSENGNGTNPPGKWYQSTPETVPIHPTEKVLKGIEKEKEAAATPFPRVHAHTPAHTREAASPPSHNPDGWTPDQTPNRPAQITVMLLRNGADSRITPNDRHIAEWVRQGATDAQVLQALEVAKLRRQRTGSQQPIGTAYLTPIIAELRNPTTTQPKGRYADDIRQMRELSAWADAQLRQQGQTLPETEIDMGAIDATRNV